MFRRGAGLAMTLAVAFAALHFSASQSGDGGASGRPPETNSRTTTKPIAQAKKKANFKGGCSAYLPESPKHSKPYDENQGLAKKVLDTFFASDTPETESKPMPVGVRYAIALAPDPFHTNLSLMFDREIALVQQAAQEEGYDYNSSWLPWKRGETASLPYLSDRQYADDLTEQRESCPGVLLFRKSPIKDFAKPGESYSRALVVFVVGEQPTGGINEGQWANAIEWLDHYATTATVKPKTTDDGVLRVLGPTFTGSMVSLERDLSNLYITRATFKAKFPSARVFSGSVTGCSSIQWFQHRLQDPPGLGANIHFGSFQENDDLHIFRFLEYLKSQGTEPKDTAFLSEDETAYARGDLAPPAPLPENSQASAQTKRDKKVEAKRKAAEAAQREKDALHKLPYKDGCTFSYARENRPLHLVYPRDISALRNAYQKESVFESSGVDAKRRSAHAILHEDAEASAGSGDVTDTVPIYSGESSAIAQEAYLYGVVSYLRVHHTQYLILRCTNPLDFLFLSRFFHRAYPQARIVTVGSDLLFRREIDTTEFRGVLSLSSYPLLPGDQHWSKITEDQWESLPHDHLIFDGNLMEGVYIAARYLLSSSTSLGGGPLSNPGDPVRPIAIDRTFTTPDYADPFWLHSAEETNLSSHPPTWVATVGRDGYWPLAVLRDEPYPAIWLDQPNGKQPYRVPQDKRPPGPISTMVQLIAQVGQHDAELNQHYELEPDANDQTRSAKTAAFLKSLRFRLPLPWTICGLISLLLAAYQIWGVYRGADHPTDGLFSIFRRTELPSQAMLLGVSCALALMPLAELVGVSVLFGEGDLVRHPNWLFIGALVFLIIGFGALCVVLNKQWGEIRPQYGHGAVTSFVVSLIGLGLLYWMTCLSNLGDPTRIPFSYRMGHLTDGVSPLVPVMLLTLGFYLWSWHAMAGNLMLAKGRPTLPERENIEAPRRGGFMGAYFNFIGYRRRATAIGVNLLAEEHNRISQEIGNRVIKVANPFFFGFRVIVIPLFIAFGALVCFAGNLPLLSLEGSSFNVVINILLLMGFLITAMEVLRFYTTWVALRRLLHALSRLRLRRTIARLRPIEANSLWSVSGNVQRVQYKLFSQQLDAARRLNAMLPGKLIFLSQVPVYGKEFAFQAESDRGMGVCWDHPVSPGIMKQRDMRDLLSEAVAEVLNKLLFLEWAAEDTSLCIEGDVEKAEEAESSLPKIALSTKPWIQAAEEFVSFHYIAFIQNIVARMRTMTLSMIFLFVTVCFAVSFYPFVPRTEISVWMILNLALIGCGIAYVYAGMERDEILSYMANTKPGRLGGEFWIKMVGFLAAPVIGILTTQFPSITDTVLEWLQPGLDAIK